MDDDEIIMRVFFELMTYDQMQKLPDSIEGAVIREDIESAGGMPELKSDIKEIRSLIIDRYKKAKEERAQ